MKITVDTNVLARADIIRAIEALANAQNIVMNRPAVEAGLAMFAAGGDFTDGVIAHEGQWLGGETLVSFDKAAVKLLSQQGRSARLLGQRERERPRLFPGTALALAMASGRRGEPP